MKSKLKNILSEINWEGKSVELGKVYSNPYATAFKPQETTKKESINEMAMGFDSMTGLFYLQGVPFTRERMKEVILFVKNSKVKSAVNQFEYTPALIIKDKVGKQEVTIDPENLKKLIEFYKKDSARLASDKDFKGKVK
jgi:hypothetical protein